MACCSTHVMPCTCMPLERNVSLTGCQITGASGRRVGCGPMSTKSGRSGVSSRPADLDTGCLHRRLRCTEVRRSLAPGHVRACCGNGNARRLCVLHHCSRLPRHGARCTNREDAAVGFEALCSEVVRRLESDGYVARSNSQCMRNPHETCSDGCEFRSVCRSVATLFMGVVGVLLVMVMCCFAGVFKGLKRNQPCASTMTRRKK